MVNDRLAGKGTSTTCHCEERSDVAIRFSLGTVRIGTCCKGNGLPHQRARWFAMTVVVGTLAEPSYVSGINVQHCTYGRGAQRMCVYHPKCVTHLPRALPAKRSFTHFSQGNRRVSFPQCKNRGIHRGFCNKKRGEEKMKKMK